MVTVKVNYLVKKEKELKLTTREWCEIHVDSRKLKNNLAIENNAYFDDIIIESGYCNIVKGELDYDNLDK